MRSLALLSLMLVAGGASAATFADIDMTSQTFERLTNGTSVATGTSNGIGWSITPGGFALLTGTASYTIGADTYVYDDVHMGDTFVITFDQAITSLLFLAVNDNSSAVRKSGIDLGFAASDSATFVQEGTAYIISDLAGYILYEFAAPVLTVEGLNVTDVEEGFDISFFANAVPSQVPLPASGLLLLGGLGALAARRRKPRAR
ncbi:VPLPA-CTERM sorting domain-containing protein [Tropicibacter sp. S64]|uniref:VPLPA-CTERM sorting domain-containing protein n=1 Tax=Tropicibacter sp. S64 TaxID=3415122 RepID=UPI003C79C2E2